MNDPKEAKEKVLIVNSMRCAGYLMLNGCVILRMEQSRRDPRKKVFIFYDDEKVNSFIRKYKNEGSQNHEAKAVYNRENQRRVQGMA